MPGLVNWKVSKAEQYGKSDLDLIFPSDLASSTYAEQRRSRRAQNRTLLKETVQTLIRGLSAHLAIARYRGTVIHFYDGASFTQFFQIPDIYHIFAQDPDFFLPFGIC